MFVSYITPLQFIIHECAYYTTLSSKLVNLDSCKTTRRTRDTLNQTADVVLTIYFPKFKLTSVSESIINTLASKSSYSG